MPPTSADLQKIAKNAPREIHKGFIAGFILCVGIAVFLALFFSFVVYNQLAWAGVVVAGIAAVIFALGMAPRSDADVLQAIKNAVIEILRENGALTPESVAKKLEWSDELTYDAIRFMVAEGELVKDRDGRVKRP
jgi:hypothetical protein